MKNTLLLELDQQISTPKFFDFLLNIDVDKALNARDLAEFDNNWMNSFNIIEEKEFSLSDLNFIDLLREKAFKYSFKVLNNADISSRVSDDIELIAKHLLLENLTDWSITYLFDLYKNKVFPC